jgi:hypothetical protein
LAGSLAADWLVLSQLIGWLTEMSGKELLLAGLKVFKGH